MFGITQSSFKNKYQNQFEKCKLQLTCCKRSDVAKRPEGRHLWGTDGRLTQCHSKKKLPVPTQEGRGRCRSPEKVRTSLDPTTLSVCEVRAWVHVWMVGWWAAGHPQCRRCIHWMDTQKWMTPLSIKHSEGSNRLIRPFFHLAPLMRDNCRGWSPFATVKHYHLMCSERFANCESKPLPPCPPPVPTLTSPLSRENFAKLVQ